MTAPEHFMVKRWATNTGCELLHSEYRMLSTGPFFDPVDAKTEVVYYVKVRDRQGNARSGWVRFGRRFWGLLSDKARVRWEN